MRKDEKAFELLNLLYGDQAGATESAGERLMRWAEAFDAWLDQQGAQYIRSLRKASKYAWGGFLSFVGKVPWEVDAGDVLAWTTFLHESGLNKNTIRNKLFMLTKFYDYCIEKQVDQGAGASESYKGFNPVRDYRSLWSKPSEVVDYLGVEEAQALLGAIDRDVSLIGKRDYALILMYLRVGWAVRDIRSLRWGDLEDGGAAGAVPEAVWRAIQDYLQASGRLNRMKAEDYVFAPIADPLKEVTSGVAEDWDSSRPFTIQTFTGHLKRYANCAGLDVKINASCLRHTAVMLRIEAGDEVEEIRKKFMPRETLEGTRRYVNQLVALAQPPRFKPEGEKRPIRRVPVRFEQGNLIALKHGFYATRLPEEDLEEVRIAQPEGLKEEIQAMRVVLRRAMEMALDAKKWGEKVKSVDMFGLSAMRLAKLLKTEKQLLEDGKTELGEAISQALDEIAEEWDLK